MNAFIRKTLIVVAVLTMVGLGGWLGRKAYQKATEHRLVTAADQYMKQHDFKNAGLCLRRAMSINPYNVTANKLTADLLDEGGSPQALSWRIRTVQLATNTVEYRFDWAQTALKLNEINSAAQALRGIDEKYRSAAEYHKLAGVLAWNIHDTKSAEKEFSEALRLEPTNQAIVLNLATVRLLSTNRTEAQEARLALEKIPADSSLYLTALRYLTADAMGHKNFESALTYSQRIIGDGRATDADKLAHLDILRASSSAGYGPWLATLKQNGSRSPQQAFALGEWMLKDTTPAAALDWLQTLPGEVQTNLPVPLVMTDCLIAMKDWNGLLNVVSKQDWEELNFYRLALATMANRQTDDRVAAERTWRRAFLLSSSHLDRLARLDQLTSAWGWDPERSEVLQEITSSFPKETWASDELVALFYANGRTREIADLLDKSYAANPSNTRLKNNLATVLMLLKSDTDKANRLAMESYNSETNNPFYTCTYAYSLLLQAKPEEAVKVLNHMKPDYLKNPSIAAYYGVVEAEAGDRNAAKEPLKLAETARLLPEEQELVRMAETRL